jgi:hypothetical protein
MGHEQVAAGVSSPICEQPPGVGLWYGSLGGYFLEEDKVFVIHRSWFQFLMAWGVKVQHGEVGIEIHCCHGPWRACTAGRWEVLMIRAPEMNYQMW